MLTTALRLMVVIVAIFMLAPIKTGYSSTGEQPTSGGDQGKSKKKKKKTLETAENNSDEAPSKNTSTSAAVRAHKPIGAEVLYTPVSDFFLQYGARTFYQSGSNWQFGLLYLGGSQDLTSKLQAETSVNIDKATATAMAFWGYARYFVGNSFSVTSGLGYRSATGSLSLSDRLGNNISATFTATSIVLPLAIGNHWAWNSGFTIGCDWIAGMFPISSGSSSTASTNLGSQALKDTTAAFDDVGASIAKINSLTLGLVSVGFMF